MHQWVEQAAGRMVVLLGAGASAPFVPVASQLTPLVLEQLDERYAAGSRLNKLWTAIKPRITGTTEMTNIEYVHQVVETLGYRDQDPTRHWVRAFHRTGSYPRTEKGRDQFQKDARSIAESITMTVAGIIRMAAETATLDHFEPLLRTPPAGIVTLNYDTLVERAATQFGVQVETGARQWDAGALWTFPANCLPVLKMHGSVNWRHSWSDWSWWHLPRIGIEELADPGGPSPNGLLDPYLIFGGNKMRPDGAWPALYTAFAEMLINADLLVVVGYSYGDPHVNASIERWAATAPHRRIIDANPWPNNSDDGSFYSELRYSLDPDFTSSRRPRGLARSEAERRLQQVEESATEALPTVFGRSSRLTNTSTM